MPNNFLLAQGIFLQPPSQKIFDMVFSFEEKLTDFLEISASVHGTLCTISGELVALLVFYLIYFGEKRHQV